MQPKVDAPRKTPKTWCKLQVPFGLTRANWRDTSCLQESRHLHHVPLGPCLPSPPSTPSDLPQGSHTTHCRVHLASPVTGSPQLQVFLHRDSLIPTRFISPSLSRRAAPSLLLLLWKGLKLNQPRTRFHRDLVCGATLSGGTWAISRTWVGEMG